MPVRKYIYDGDAVLQETDGAGNVLTEYTRTGGGYGDLLSAYDGTNARYYEPDALGSTDALADQSQAVADRWSYRAFGTASQTAGTDATPFTWVGRQGYFSDSETGLYLLGSGTRYYDPTTAVFISQDPVGFWGDLHLYRYAANNSVNLIDPSGFATEEQCKAAIKAVKAGVWYKALQAQFAAKKCGALPDPDCRNNPPLPGVFGGHNLAANTISIYYESQSVAQLPQTIVHELIHALDNCLGLFGLSLVDSGARDACSELRAYWFSGGCNNGVLFGGLLEPGQSTSDCLFEQAVASLAGPANLTFTPETYVCCVWDICLSDKRLPGTGFYDCAMPPRKPKRPDKCKERDNRCKDALPAEAKKQLEDWFK